MDDVYLCCIYLIYHVFYDSIISNARCYDVYYGFFDIILSSIFIIHSYKCLIDLKSGHTVMCCLIKNSLTYLYFVLY